MSKVITTVASAGGVASKAQNSLFTHEVQCISCPSQLSKRHAMG